MKTNFSAYMILMTIVIFSIESCKKYTSFTGSENSNSSIAAAVANLQALAVGTSSAGSGSAADSIYVIHTCDINSHRDSVSFSNLPSAIKDYLNTNYSGYTAQKAFTIRNASGIFTGFVVIIHFNGNPVGLKFDASGNFLNVLEQREGKDLEGPGWHDGGLFEDRDGKDKDTISINSLPASITSYFSANYSSDTLLKAFVLLDSSDKGYMVISKNKGVYATFFNTSGNFVKRVSFPQPHEDKLNSLNQSDLPATSLTYLNSTYSGYVFKQAFSISENGIVQGYIVFINANYTKYAVEFDAAGTFVKAVTIH